jgi:hypothetical protein
MTGVTNTKVTNTGAVMRGVDWLRYAQAWLGWPGTAGIALLAGAALLYVAQVQPLQSDSLELQRQAEQMAKAPPVTPDASLKAATLSVSLPAAEQMPESVARMFSAARHAGLSLEQGVYRAASEKSSRLLRYQISLPVNGDYPAVRAFVAEALEREPSLALDSLRMKRDALDQGVVDADLRFTLYLGEMLPEGTQ